MRGGRNVRGGKNNFRENLDRVDKDNREKRRVKRADDRKAQEQAKIDRQNDNDEIQAASGIKLKLFFALFVAVIAVMMGFILHYQINYGSEYHHTARVQLVNRRRNDTAITPGRGMIMDRGNNVLAASSVIFNIFIDVRMLVLEDFAVQADSVEKVSRILGIPEDRLWGYLVLADEETRVAVIDRHYHVITRQVAYDTARELERLNPKHVHLEYDSRRVYRHDGLASAVIGFTRGGTSWGLENQYNNRLTGIPGRIFYYFDADRNVTMDRIEAVEGSTIITTLDIELQRIAERLCEEHGNRTRAANASIIVMNPNTGEIYVMAQYPTFNLNDPTNLEYINNERLRGELELLSHNEQMAAMNRVWRNYNITSALEIGSVYKPLTVAKALEEGIIDVDARFYCNGYLMVGTTRIPCHSRHGDQSLSQTISNSCNAAMMEIVELMGRETFFRYQTDFGYGERTGIDFQGEATGLLHSLPRLGPTELATASFGQRFMATPLQVAVSFASLINGGNVMQPYLVSQIQNERGFVIYDHTPTVLRKAISAATSDWLRTEMVKVVTEGTGRTARIDGYAVAGKTGTAEQGILGSDDFMGFSLTFAGYYPVDNPQYLIVAILDQVCTELYDSGAARSSAPMFREMLEAIINDRNIPPTNSDSTMLNGAVLENYVGMTAENAINAILNAGLEYDIIGSGGSVVISQTFGAGMAMSRGGIVPLILDNGDRRELVAVPGVKEKTLETAEAELLQAGFIPHVTGDVGEKIVRQTPDAGVRLPAGSRVIIG
jgi:stage V sporulation protein D (sporulation-specific penicillin-binding protein)